VLISRQANAISGLVVGMLLVQFDHSWYPSSWCAKRCIWRLVLLVHSRWAYGLKPHRLYIIARTGSRVNEIKIRIAPVMRVNISPNRLNDT
jgi:hypothetical protein